jgi:hypothetical protein
MFLKKTNTSHAAGERRYYREQTAQFERPPRNFCKMTCVTQSMPNRALMWLNGSLRLRQGGRYRFFFTNMLHFMQHVCEKDKICTLLPPANDAIIGRKRPV